MATFKMVSTKEERTCGGCSLCCKAMGVDQLDKPVGKWCQHSVAGGCGVYPDRLTDENYSECNRYKCMWLQGHFDTSDRPDKIKIVPSMTKHPDPAHEKPLAVFNEAFPGAGDGRRATELRQGLLAGGFSVMVRNQDYAVEYLPDGTVTRRPIDATDPMRSRVDLSVKSIDLTIRGRSFQ